MSEKGTSGSWGASPKTSAPAGWTLAPVDQRPSTEAPSGAGALLLSAAPVLELAARLAAGKWRDGLPECHRRAEILMQQFSRTVSSPSADAALAATLDRVALASNAPEHERQAWAARPLANRFSSGGMGKSDLAKVGEQALVDAGRSAGPILLLHACLTLVAAAERDPARAARALIERLHSAALSRGRDAPELIGALGPDAGGARRRIILAGEEGAGKSTLMTLSGLAFIRSAQLPRAERSKGYHEHWSAGGIQVVEAADTATGSPDEVLVRVVASGRWSNVAAAVREGDDYLVLTKLDEVPGFEAFFGDLDDRSRASPCGAVGGPSVTATAELAEAVAWRLHQRLHTERDAGALADLFGFAAQIGSLKLELDASPAATVLKGIYLTSARQHAPPSGSFVLSSPANATAFFIEPLIEKALISAATASSGASDGISRRTLVLTGAFSILLLAAGALFIIGDPPADPAAPQETVTAPEADPAEKQTPPVATGVAVTNAEAPAAPLPEGGAQPAAPLANVSLEGPLAQVYASIVLPACQRAVDGRYPFYGTSNSEASVSDVRAAFGPGGVLPRFIEQRLKPLLTTEGPVWRWRRGAPETSAFDPATPDEFAKVGAISDLLAQGVSFTVEAAAFTGGVTAASLAIAGATHRFDAAGGGARSIRWTPGSATEASVTLMQRDRVIRSFQVSNAWAPLRLMSQGRSTTAGPGRTSVTFGDGVRSAAFTLTAGEGEPFGRGGLWSFRCPKSL